jgi:hypothetical protein
MKKISIVLCIICSLGSMNAGSQLVSGAMKFNNPIQAKDSNSFSIAYSTLSYFRDYEYFKNNVQTGFTYFGTWHYPRLVVQPNKWLKIEAGALLQKEFGDAGPQKAIALFSMQFIPQKNLRILFGALEGTLSHQLIEPLMGYDRIITRPVEEGFQIKYNTHHIMADIWLDWELRQTFNSNYPEELAGGLSFAYTFTKPGNAWQVKAPLQFITPHKGGQLDTNGSIVSTVINSAAGLAAEWNNPANKGFLKQFKIDGYYSGYRHFHKSNLYPFNKGRGQLVNIFIKSKYDIAFLASFWNGTNYIAPFGAPIYQSISSISGRENYQEPKRKLLMLNLLYEKELFPNFFVDARVSPYIDLKKGYMEHSFLILFSYRNNFRIGPLKK